MGSVNPELADYGKGDVQEDIALVAWSGRGSGPEGHGAATPDPSEEQRGQSVAAVVETSGEEDASRCRTALPDRSSTPIRHPKAADIKRSLERDLQREARVVHRIHDALRQYRDIDFDGQSLVRLQMERLRSILNHALTQVPAYRQLGIQRSAVDTNPFVALKRFPLFDRTAAQQGFVDYCSDDLDPCECYLTRTSGTTGMPLKVAHHLDHLVHYHGLALRRLDLRGLPHARRILTPCQVWLEEWFEYTSPARGYSRVAEFGISRDDWEQRAAMARRAGEFDPDVVLARPTQLLEFLALLDEQRTREVHPRIVVSYGEWLSPANRQLLSQRLGAPICDLYGMQETNTIAAECPEGKYHIECERLWVEVVDKAGQVLPDGEIGEIVVTNFMNTAMPLIRYRTGDIGMLASAHCGCGLPHKILGLVAGRDPGVIRLADGDAVDVFRLSRLIRRFPVERFQIVQVSQARVDVLIRSMPSLGDELLMSLRRDASALLRDRIDVSVQAVDGNESFIVEDGRAKAVEFVSLLPRAAVGRPGEDKR